MKIHWKLISWDEGIKHIQNSKIIPTPEDYINNNVRNVYDQSFGSSVYAYNQGVAEVCWNTNETSTFFEGNTCMRLVSDWDGDYYGEVDGNDPLFFLGIVDYEASS